MAAEIHPGGRLRNMKVAIVDYGMGNIRSIMGALKHIGAAEAEVTAEYERLRQADRLILPGVGAFGPAIARVKEKGIDLLLAELVMKEKKPILGICLGMQLLGAFSDEDGRHTGLGFINGEVRRFEDLQVRVPHVGFNQVNTDNKLKLYKGFGSSADFYFTHSYRMTSDSRINQCCCSYGGDFVASYELDNVAGVQFHPELSQYNGLALLKNYLDNF